ncbi:MAG TPA: hypothetical protein ENJ56_02195 [Anaerolineae bacterium]|nr:hypothetical protein [Anaerolineae bacterium]
MDEFKEAEKQKFKEAARQRKKKSNDFTGGLVLITIGVVFLLAQYTDFRFDNWWALFILIPVLAAWGKAASAIKAAGGWTQEAVRSVMGSLFPLFVAAIFLFQWDWGRVWPGFIILAGLGALANNWARNLD